MIKMIAVNIMDVEEDVTILLDILIIMIFLFTTLSLIFQSHISLLTIPILSILSIHRIHHILPLNTLMDHLRALHSMARL